MRLIPFAVLLTLLINATAAQGFDDLSSRATLKGLRDVHVVVEEFTDHEKAAGFDKRTLQTDVELKLRLAGIKVLTKAEWRDAQEGSYLYLNVNALHKKPDDWSAFTVLLRFTQLVRLERNGVLLTAPTWSTGKVSYGDVSFARDIAKDLADKFINAWLSVNPK